MLDINSKTDAEWRKRMEEQREQYEVKLMEMQKDVDQSRYESSTYKADRDKATYLITYVLDYFLNERNIKVPDRDLDLFYLSDIFDKFHEKRERDQDDV